jgi:hypothetical protein
MRRSIPWFLVTVFAIGVAHAASQRCIGSVKLDRASLNLVAHEVLTITVNFAKAGTASVLVVDRDGYAVRSLAKLQPVRGGPISFGWDGRDDHGQLVADEAYSLKIDWRGRGASDTYFPGNAPATMSTIPVRAYDRRTATLSYTLPQPSRVHIQAGTAVLDPKTKQLIGPVMKTIVNREPRSVGAIAEHWSGYDESSKIFVPDLENFVVAIAASPLPENSVITFGNRERRFVDTLTSRRGDSLFTVHGGHEHHAGLPTEDDISPALRIAPVNAAWSATDHAWIVKPGRALQLRLSAEGPTAAAFRSHPATVELFVDGRRVGKPSKKTRDVVTLPLRYETGVHRVSVNWNSEWGPVAANTIQIRIAGGDTAAGGSR